MNSVGTQEIGYFEWRKIRQFSSDPQKVLAWGRQHTGKCGLAADLERISLDRELKSRVFKESLSSLKEEQTTTALVWISSFAFVGTRMWSTVCYSWMLVWFYSQESQKHGTEDQKAPFSGTLPQPIQRDRRDGLGSLPPLIIDDFSSSLGVMWYSQI